MPAASILATLVIFTPDSKSMVRTLAVVNSAVHAGTVTSGRPTWYRRAGGH